MGKVSREDIVEKFKEAFKDEKYTVLAQTGDRGSSFAIAVHNNESGKRQAIMVERLKTISSTMGWNYDDDEETMVWKSGPPYTHEKIGLITHPDTIDENIQKLREVIG